VSPAEFERWLAASRAASGVPERVEDLAVLSRVAVLVVGAAEPAEGGERRAAKSA
jgi:hypothetical protein